MVISSTYHDGPGFENNNKILEDRDLLILYATETGTARDAADRIARECRRIYFNCRVSSMHAYPLSELISESLVIFVVSTTGSGAEPRSMTPLWQQLLRSDLPADLFEDLEYASFGLGDTSYEKFCWPSKLLSRRLESLGGSEICERGEGDEQDRLGIDGALDPWISGLLEALLKLYHLPGGKEVISAETIPPSRVMLCDVSNDTFKEFIDPLEMDNKYHTATVKCNRRITADDWYQDVRHFEFDISDDIQYNPGDVAVIHPEASPAEVESFLTSMGWINLADVPFAIKHAMPDQSLPDHLPEIATLRQIFTRYVDFNAVPRRFFFQMLRHFISDDLEREKLDEFLSVEGADDLYEYCYQVRRTIREVLSEFRSANVPKDYIFDLFPPMRPREFSISSSIDRHPHQIHLCVAIVKYRTKLRIPRRGVCTSYLASLHDGKGYILSNNTNIRDSILSGDLLRIGLRKGLIILPKDPSVPIVCVGPGTGIAPMRALIEYRIHRGSNRNTLYFGCRHASKDQHYSSEFQSYAQNNNLVYRVACSRDGPEGVKRIYVQDLIVEDGQAIWNALGETGGWIYISGSSNKMPAGVKQAIREVAEKYGGKTENDAKAFIAQLEREGRLIEECWS